MQDAHLFIEAKGIELNGYLDPSRPALLDAEHRLRINYENFFFADRANYNRFVTELTRYCGLLTDPVTKRRFHPTPDAHRTTYEGVVYLFQDGRSAEAFRADPGRFALPGWSM